MECKTQKDEVLDYLYKNGSITSWDAIKKGITRLSDIIFRLRKQGYEIKTENVTEKNRYGNPTTFARYYLIKDIH